MLSSCGTFFSRRRIHRLHRRVSRLVLGRLAVGGRPLPRRRHTFVYWASTVAQQGMDWRVMLKTFGHSDFRLILSTYFAQNDDERLVAEASRIDFGLGLAETA